MPLESFAIYGIQDSYMDHYKVHRKIYLSKLKRAIKVEDTLAYLEGTTIKKTFNTSVAIWIIGCIYYHKIMGR